MKKLAIISPGFLPVPAVNGGAVEVLTEYLIELNEISNDFEIDIYTVADNRLNSYNYKNANIIQVKTKFYNRVYCGLYNRIFKPSIKKFSFCKSLRDEYKGNYDYVLVENNMYLYQDVFNKEKNKDTKFIFHLHNDIFDEGKPKYLCEFIANTAYKVVCVSNYIKSRFMLTPCNENKIEVLYNCVDLELFKPKEKVKKNKKDFNFLYLGRICDEKGVLELVNAFKKFNSINKKSKLTIVGSSWFDRTEYDEFELKLLKASEDIKDRITFTGYVNHNDIPNYIEDADCVVIPSKWEEPFGVVALEAMAMKKAIIATKSGGLIEPLDKNTAIIIDRKNLENNLYESMNKIYNEDDFREKIANNAYNKINSVLDFNKIEYLNNFIKVCDIEVDKNEIK